MGPGPAAAACREWRRRGRGPRERRAVSSSSSASIPCAPASALPSISGSPGSAAWASARKRSMPARSRRNACISARKSSTMAWVLASPSRVLMASADWACCSASPSSKRNIAAAVSCRSMTAPVLAAPSSSAMRRAWESRSVRASSNMSMVPSWCRARSRHTASPAASAVARACSKASLAASRSFPRRIRPSSSSAWQRTWRTCLRRGQGALGEGASLVDVAVGERDLGVQGGRLGGEAGLRIGREQVAGDCELPPGGGPPGCHPPPRGPASGAPPPGRRLRRHLAAAG